MDRLATGKLKPIVDRVFPWEEIAETHRHPESDQQISKIVVTV